MALDVGEDHIRKNFFDSGEGYPDGETYDLAKELIDTADFQRLKRISFLGAIDYIFHPNGRFSWARHNRYHHSIAVGRLASAYGTKASLSLSERREILAAALLHDIGHMPLSHSIEKVYEERFGINHHILGERIIKGAGPNGARIKQILSSHKVDIDSVCALIGADKSHSSWRLFAKPINIDTIEAIYRSKMYISKGNVDPAPDLVVAYFYNGSSAKDIGDRFWRDKDEVYTYLINGPAGRIADFIAFNFLEKNRSSLKEGDVELTDVGLRHKYPALFLMFRSIRRSLYGSGLSSILTLAEKRVKIRRRRFLIDESYEPDVIEGGRYVEIKEWASAFDVEEVFRQLVRKSEKESMRGEVEHDKKEQSLYRGEVGNNFTDVIRRR